MSSPIAFLSKSKMRKLLIKFHKKNSHSHRITILSKLFSNLIKDLGIKRENLSGLDIGCGDMQISKNLEKALGNISFSQVDKFPLPDNLAEDPDWSKYFFYDGKNLPFKDNHFDIAILSDVLHHDMANVSKILSEALRTSRYVLIKDHFEFGFFSRQILRLMDFVGNWAYGVSVPSRYLTIKQYEDLCEQARAKEIRRITPIQLYEHNIIFRNFINPNLQFISVIEKKH